MREDLIDFIEKRGLPLIDELKSLDELKQENHRILIVDDEKNVVKSVKVILEDLAAKMQKKLDDFWKELD